MPKFTPEDFSKGLPTLYHYPSTADLAEKNLRISKILDSKNFSAIASVLPYLDQYLSVHDPEKKNRRLLKILNSRCQEAIEMALPHLAKYLETEDNTEKNYRLKKIKANCYNDMVKRRIDVYLFFNEQQRKAQSFVRSCNATVRYAISFP